MWKKDKVKKMQFSGNSKANASYTAGEKNNDDQEYYEGKVKGLMECCRNFEKSLKGIKAVNEFTADSIEWRFNYHFGKTMKKMFSKTSRVLKDMDKKLKKLKKKPLAVLDKDNVYIKDDNLVKAIKESFKYNGPKSGWDKDTIDRAAIYDKTVYDFFNGESPQKSLQVLIDDLAGRAVEIKQKESQKNIAAWVGKKMGLIEKQVKDIKKEYEELLKKYNALLKQDANQELEKATKELNGVKNKFESLQKEFNAKVNEVNDLAAKLKATGGAAPDARSRVAAAYSEMMKLNALQVSTGNNVSSLPELKIDSTTVSELGYDRNFGDKNGMDFKLNSEKLFVQVEGAAGSYKTVGELIDSLKDDIDIFIRNFETIPDKMEGKDEESIKNEFDMASKVIEGFWKNVEEIKAKINEISKSNSGNDKDRIDIIKKITNNFKEKVVELENEKEKMENVTKKMFVVNSQIVAKIVTEYKGMCKKIDEIVKKENKNKNNLKSVAKKGNDQYKVLLNIIDNVRKVNNDLSAAPLDANSLKEFSDVNLKLNNKKTEVANLKTEIANMEKAQKGKAPDEKLTDARTTLENGKEEVKSLSADQESKRRSVDSALKGLNGAIQKMQVLKTVSGNENAKKAVDAMLKAVVEALTANGKNNVVDISKALETAKVNAANLRSVLLQAAGLTEDVLKNLEAEQNNATAAAEKEKKAIDNFKSAGNEFVKSSKSQDNDEYEKALEKYNAAKKDLLAVDKFAHVNDVGKPQVAKPQVAKPQAAKPQAAEDHQRLLDDINKGKAATAPEVPKVPKAPSLQSLKNNGVEWPKHVPKPKGLE